MLLWYVMFAVDKNTFFFLHTLKSEWLRDEYRAVIDINMPSWICQQQFSWWNGEKCQSEVADTTPLSPILTIYYSPQGNKYTDVEDGFSKPENLNSHGE